jgi:glutamate-1-semialdehyde 2,1-aminomutase
VAAIERQNTLLDTALDAARRRYVDQRPRSRELCEVAAAFMPGGNTRSSLFHTPFPIRVARGEGASFEDVDGHRYLNLLGEFTAGVYGHSHPVIRAAIDEALDRGANFGAHNTYEIELARLICDRFPSIERVRFTNSGTEANLMAVSTARALTGRTQVMVFRGGYHGALLYFAGDGSRINAPFPYVVGRYNDAAGARQAMHANADGLACVLVEPMLGSAGCIPGDREFLSMLRDETRRCGALLIFDEVMTSRLAPGGLQERLDLRPDLTTLGKYIGGGMSFGAFGGARQIMELYDPRRRDALPHAGTFNNNVLTMAAGSAGLSRVFTPDAAVILNRRGDTLRTRLNELFCDAGAPLQATGLGSLMNFHATTKAVRCPDDLSGSDDRVKELLFFDLLEDGYYVARRGFVALSLAVSDRDLDGFVAAVARFVDRRGTALRLAAHPGDWGLGTGD